MFSLEFSQCQFKGNPFFPALFMTSNLSVYFSSNLSVLFFYLNMNHDFETAFQNNEHKVLISGI